MTGDGNPARQPESPPTGGRLLTGRHPADRRIRRPIDRPPYFRHAGPGTVIARPAATEPHLPFERAAARARRVLFGRPLSSDEEATEQLSKVKALAVFSSDNLSSVAYATEAILFTLLAAGSASFWLTLPISLLIVLVLGIIVVSYRQTIREYPGGGGSYIVAGQSFLYNDNARRIEKALLGRSNLLVAAVPFRRDL